MGHFMVTPLREYHGEGVFLNQYDVKASFSADSVEPFQVYSVLLKGFSYQKDCTYVSVIAPGVLESFSLFHKFLETVS
jgi:hypothetical protein